MATKATKTEATISSTTDKVTLPKSNPNARWWVIAGSSALLITALVAAVVYLVTKKPSVVDQVVILTVPSGAEVSLNGVSYGLTPVKLEKVKVGTYRLTISKENYDTVDKEVTITDSTPLDFKLKTSLPPEVAARSHEEQLQEFRDLAEEYFASGRYANAGEQSAIRYVELIQAIDPNNEYARNKREEIRRALLQNAQADMNRGQLGSAKEYFNQLREYFPDDEEGRAGANRLEALLSSKKGEIADWIRKAETAFRAGKLIEPFRFSAFYYAREALAIDSQNAPALALNNKIKERLLAIADQYEVRGDEAAEIRQLQIISQYFPKDSQVRARLASRPTRHDAEVPKANDPGHRRREGLNKHSNGQFAGAIEDLEFALDNGVPESAEILYALGRSYKETGNYEKALYYLGRILPLTGEQYISGRGLMGDIEARRGNNSRAIEHYEDARQRGGSIMYSVDTLNDRIETLEKRAREKADAPTPVSIAVKHNHGLLLGSCRGTLAVTSAGIRYIGSDHPISFNLIGVGIRINKKKMEIVVQGKATTFEGESGDLERFTTSLTKFQNAATK